MATDFTQSKCQQGDGKLSNQKPTSQTTWWLLIWCHDAAVCHTLCAEACKACMLWWRLDDNIDKMPKLLEADCPLHCILSVYHNRWQRVMEPMTTSGQMVQPFPHVWSLPVASVTSCLHVHQSLALNPEPESKPSCSLAKAVCKPLCKVALVNQPPEQGAKGLLYWQGYVQLHSNSHNAELGGKWCTSHVSHSHLRNIQWISGNSLTACPPTSINTRAGHISGCNLGNEYIHCCSAYLCDDWYRYSLLVYPNKSNRHSQNSSQQAKNACELHISNSTRNKSFCWAYFWYYSLKCLGACLFDPDKAESCVETIGLFLGSDGLLAV